MEIPPWMQMPWRAWHQLDAERQYIVAGIGAPLGGTMITSRPRPIPWSAVRSWCQWHCLGEEDSEFVREVVAGMDEEFLAWQAKDQVAGATDVSAYPEAARRKRARWKPPIG